MSLHHKEPRRFTDAHRRRRHRHPVHAYLGTIDADTWIAANVQNIHDMGAEAYAARSLQVFCGVLALLDA